MTKKPVDWYKRRCTCEVALRFMGRQREVLRGVGAKAAADAVAKALKSIDGARRHADRMFQQERREQAK